MPGPTVVAPDSLALYKARALKPIEGSRRCLHGPFPIPVPSGPSLAKDFSNAVPGGLQVRALRAKEDRHGRGVVGAALAAPAWFAFRVVLFLSGPACREAPRNRVSPDWTLCYPGFGITSAPYGALAPCRPQQVAEPAAMGGSLMMPKL